MDSAVWIGVYLPIFVLLFIILPQQNAHRKLIISKKRKKRGAIKMTNALLKKCIGKKCLISTGSLGTNIMGEIKEVDENWVQVETKKNVEYINAEYVLHIKIIK